MNILSIDFDIIMAPDIPLYNHLIQGTDANGKNISLQTIAKDFPSLNYCRADLGHYQKIFLYLVKIIPYLDVDDIRVSFNHEDIKFILEEASDAHVFNIDHHHDLGYYDRPEKRKNDNICSCANWGDYFFRNGTITKFTWLKNVNSDENQEYKEDPRVEYLDLRDYDLNNLPKFDKLFICLSPEWVSENYFPLFYMILDYINKEKNCHLEIH